MNRQILNSPFLRRVLFLDALTCVAAGLLMGFGAGMLEPILGLPVALMRYAGLSLFPFAALLVYLGTREAIAPGLLRAVIVLNVLWTVASLLLIVSGWVSPTTIGAVFVIAQALGVGAFAGLEYAGMRKVSEMAAA